MTLRTQQRQTHCLLQQKGTCNMVQSTSKASLVMHLPAHLHQDYFAPEVRVVVQQPLKGSQLQLNALEHIHVINTNLWTGGGREAHTCVYIPSEHSQQACNAALERPSAGHSSHPWIW